MTSLSFPVIAVFILLIFTHYIAYRMGHVKGAILEIKREKGKL